MEWIDARCRLRPNLHDAITQEDIRRIDVDEFNEAILVRANLFELDLDAERLLDLVKLRDRLKNS